MNEEPKLNIESMMDRITDIEDFNLYALNRIHDGDIFKVDFTGVDTSIVWQFAKLDFQKFELDELKDSFLNMASATADAVNKGTFADDPNSLLAQTTEKLQMYSSEPGFANVELAEAILRGSVSTAEILATQQNTLEQYIADDGKRFMKPNRQEIDIEAKEYYESTVLPALQELVASQTTDNS